MADINVGNAGGSAPIQPNQTPTGKAAAFNPSAAAPGPAGTSLPSPMSLSSSKTAAPTPTAEMKAAQTELDAMNEVFTPPGQKSAGGKVAVWSELSKSQQDGLLAKCPKLKKDMEAFDLANNDPKDKDVAGRRNSFVLGKRKELFYTSIGDLKQSQLSVDQKKVLNHYQMRDIQMQIYNDSKKAAEASSKRFKEELKKAQEEG